MGNYSGIGDAVVGAMQWLFWLLVAAIPLVIWKLIDIIIWMCNHVSIGITA